MDQPDRVSRAEMVGSLVGIRRVNSLLGGTRSMIEQIDPLLLEARRQKIATVRLCDIGTGAADIPLALVKHAKKRKIDLHIVAVEMNADLAAAAREHTKRSPQISVVTADARKILRAAARNLPTLSDQGTNTPAPAEPFHIVTASLFLHHFPPAEVTDWIALMQAASTLGWIVNDLERHILALAGFRIAAPFICRNPVFLHDGALSVKRAYTEKEWRQLAERARAGNLTVTRRWPWRVLMRGGGSR